MNNHETYPTIDKDILFYLEFTEYKGEWSWSLYKRVFLPEIMPLEHFPFSNEGHPWKLAEGKINTNEHAQDLYTLPYLKFMVDSFNKNK